MIHYYHNTDTLKMGITLRNLTLPDQGNMGIVAPQTRTDVLKNRHIFLKALNLTPSHYVQAHQTHSKHCVQVTQADGGRGFFDPSTAFDQTDALYTLEPDLLLAIFTADCVPLLFYDEESPLIGAIHSGWRGTVQNITQATFSTIFDRHPHLKPDTFHVQLGPSLSPLHFEVDKDVYEQFKGLNEASDCISYDSARKKWHIDNRRVVKNQCLKAGILEKNIRLYPLDTYESPYGFSYRENHTPRRHLHFIWRK